MTEDEVTKFVSQVQEGNIGTLWRLYIEVMKETIPIIITSILTATMCFIFFFFYY